MGLSFPHHLRPPLDGLSTAAHGEPLQQLLRHLHHVTARLEHDVDVWGHNINGLSMDIKTMDGNYLEKCPVRIWKRYIPLLIDLLIPTTFLL